VRLFAAGVCLLALMACKSANQAPAIAALTATPDSVGAGGTCILRVTATDPDGDSLSFAWDATAGLLSSASGDSVTWTAPAADGVYGVSVIASDDHATDVENSKVTVGKPRRYMVAGYTIYTEAWAFMETGSLVELLSEPLVATATVSVGGRTLRSYGTPGTNTRTFADTLMPTPGTAQALTIETNLGNCTATCTVPGGFAYTSPTNETLPVGSTLVMAWTAAAMASWYQVHLSYTVLDSGIRTKETLFVVASTSAAIPGTWFDGDGWAYLFVMAGNGPSPDPSASAPGNVQGDAKGYWVGINSIYKVIIVGNGDRSRQPARSIISSALLRRLVDQYAKRGALQR